MSEATPFISALSAAFGGCAPKRACGRSPGEFAQRIKIAMISGGDHTMMFGGPRRGSEEERRDPKGRKKSQWILSLNVSARIPTTR